MSSTIIYHSIPSADYEAATRTFEHFTYNNLLLRTSATDLGIGHTIIGTVANLSLQLVTKQPPGCSDTLPMKVSMQIFWWSLVIARSPHRYQAYL